MKLKLLLAFSIALVAIMLFFALPSDIDSVFFEGANIHAVKASCASRGWAIRPIAGSDRFFINELVKVYQVTIDKNSYFSRGYYRVEFMIDERAGCITKIIKTWVSYSL